LPSLILTIPHTESDSIEAELLSTCQAMLVQNKYDLTDQQSSLRLYYCEKLEEIILQLVDWKQQLFTQSGLLVNCLSLRETEGLTAIESRPQHTGIVPFMKQHILLENKNYLSFGRINVKLADQIVTALQHKTAWRNFDGLVNQLKISYELACQKAMDEVSVIQEQTQGSTIDETAKAVIAQKLTEKTELIDKLTNTLQTLEEMPMYFNSYCNLLLEAIEKGQWERNQKFQQQHPWLFN